MIRIPYGASHLDLPADRDARVLLPNSERPARAQADILRAALDEPVAGPPLRDLAKGRRSAVVLISCRTRRTGSALFVPMIRAILNDAGLADDRILVLTATGTHDNWRDEDAPLLLGEAAGRLRVAGHDCRSEAALADVGTTSLGNRVRLNRAVLEADLTIATGRVTHHYFAGFTAGPKAILPGVAALDTILTNHQRTIILENGTARLDPDARNGNLDTNPVHKEMVEAMRMAPPDFSLLTVLNAAGEVTHAFGGETLAAHRDAVAVVRAADAPEIDEPADLVVASPGGAPYDGNAIQSLKALVNAEEAIRSGGAVVLVAECAEGAPAWLLEAAAVETEAELARRIRDGSIRRAHNALWLRRIRRRAPVVMVTRLADDAVRTLGFHKAPDLATAVAVAERLAGRPRRTFVIPHGNVTYPRARHAAG
jgi:nickel-dependent lactate racemase